MTLLLLTARAQHATHLVPTLAVMAANPHPDQLGFVERCLGHDAPEVRAFLDSQQLVIEQAGDDPGKAGVEEFLFHAGLAKLGGNAVLELFLRILVEVFRRYWASTDQPVPSHADLADVRHAHLRIIEAIGQGDDSLARALVTERIARKPAAGAAARQLITENGGSLDALRW